MCDDPSVFTGCGKNKFGLSNCIPKCVFVLHELLEKYAVFSESLSLELDENERGTVLLETARHQCLSHVFPYFFLLVSMVTIS